MIDEQPWHALTAGTRLCLELGSRLNLQAKACPSPLACDLIGMDPDRYLIVTAPHAAPECVETLLHGVAVSVTCFCKDAALAFESKVLTMISDPARLLFLEYPGNLQLRDRRTQKRISCSISAHVESMSAVRPATVVNINKRGCRCIIDNKEGIECNTGLHEQVAMRLRIPNEGHEIAMTGRVKNVSLYERQMSLGILFQESSLESQKWLSQYLFSAYDYQEICGV